MRAVLLPLALATVAGCGDPFGPGDLRDWAAARAQWNSRLSPDYDVEMTIACFCPPEINQWTRVTVVGGKVVAARPVAGGENYPATALAQWPTVDEIFSRIRYAGGDDVVRRVVVEYDRVMGYPTRLSVDYDANILDAGATYRLRNLTLLESGSAPPQ